MMTYTYHAHRSEMMDVFYVPLFLYEKADNIEWEMSQKEREILTDIWPIKEEIKAKLEPLAADLKRYYLFGSATSLAHILYFYLIYQKKEEPKTVAETLALFETLTEEEIKLCYRYTLYRDYVEETVADIGLLGYLDKIDIPAEEKWHWYQAIQHPLDTVRKLAKLLAQVETIYRPYYEQFAAERQAYVDRFDLEDFFEDMPTTGLRDSAAQLGVGYELIVLSPIHIRVMAFFMTEDFDMDVLLVTSTRMEQLIAHKDDLDMDSFSTILKVISDPTRYQVLAEMTRPHAKNKLIAEQLGITGAAVSFHIQKLINSKLVLVDNEDNTRKYKVNHGLVKQVIDKLRQDVLKGNSQAYLIDDTTSEKDITEMKIIREDGQWYDQNGRPLSDQEKEQIKQQVFLELDEELADNGFSSFIKKVVKWSLDKAWTHGTDAMTIVVNQEEADNDNLEDLDEEIADLQEELSDMGDEMSELGAEMAELGQEMDKLGRDMEETKQKLERLLEKREQLDAI